MRSPFALAPLIVVMVLMLALAQNASALVPPEGLAPTPPRVPGSIGLPAPSSPSAASAIREAATSMLTRELRISEAEAGRRLDLQAEAGDLHGRLVERLGPVVSQVSFDHDAGRIVVAIGPRASEQGTRQALEDFGLAGSQIKRAGLDHRELIARVEAVGERLADVVRAGNATVGVAADGVQITVAADASAEQRGRIAAAGVDIERSAQSDLSAPASACAQRPNGRYCDLLRGGSTWFDRYRRCTLGWWSGYRDGRPDQAFLTAGHCIARGEPWHSCDSTGASCTWAGHEVSGQVDYDGGDYGLMSIVNASWWREAGYTDWNSLSRVAITHYRYHVSLGWVICLSGSRTGYSCGVVTHNDLSTSATSSDGSMRTLTHMIRATGICAQPGDSGGPVFTPPPSTVAGKPDPREGSRSPHASAAGAVGVTSAGGQCPGASYTEPIWRMIATYDVWPYGG